MRIENCIEDGDIDNYLMSTKFIKRNLKNVLSQYLPLRKFTINHKSLRHHRRLLHQIKMPPYQ
jgi:hypothetical protein